MLITIIFESGFSVDGEVVLLDFIMVDVVDVLRV